MSIVIIGAGALGREVLAVLQAAGCDVSGFAVERGYSTAEVHGVPVYDDWTRWDGMAQASFVVAVGDGRVRQRLTAQLPGRQFATAIHPAATLGPRVSLGDGTMILGAVNVTVDVTIGSHVVVYPGCTLAHDCQVDSYASLGPGVNLAGGVTLKEGVSMGVGALVTPGCTIGDWATVGAGAVVIDDVEPGSTVAGVPARPLPRPGVEPRR